MNEKKNIYIYKKKIKKKINILSVAIFSNGFFYFFIHLLFLIVWLNFFWRPPKLHLRQHVSGSHNPNTSPHWPNLQEPKVPELTHDFQIKKSRSKNKKTGNLTRRVCVNPRARIQQDKCERATHQDFYGNIGPQPGA